MEKLCGGKEISEVNKVKILCYLNQKPIINCEKMMEKLSFNNKVLFLQSIGNFSEIISIFKVHEESKISTKVLNVVFDLCLNYGEIAIVKELYNKYSLTLSNSNKCNMFFSQGLFYEGFKMGKNRDVSNLLSKTLEEKYLQAIKKINPSSSLLVINSWGIGDDIRFSTLIPLILDVHSYVMFSCEPRLFTLFSILYPKADFITSERSKVISVENYDKYFLLPERKLHHIMDNKLDEKLVRMDKCSLITDLVPDLHPGRGIDSLPFLCDIKTVCKNNKVGEFISGIKKMVLNLLGYVGVVC